MKKILLWDPRFPMVEPARLTLHDDIASAAVRAGVAAPADAADYPALLAGGPLEPGEQVEIVVEHGLLKELRRVVVPEAVASVALSLGLGASSVWRPGLGIPGDAPTYTPLLASPGPLWNGTAGSGFAVVPTDPPRSTAKPACHPIVVTGQRFTDDIVIGCFAAAGSSDAILNMANFGLQKVIFHVEGQAYEALRPTVYSFVAANGQMVSYLAWWVTLKRSAFPVNGDVQVFYEAVPADTTMQNRVSGPHLFYCQAAEFDYDVAVGTGLPTVAGVSYPTIQAAMAYFKAQSANNPRIRITVAGTYAPASVGLYTTGKGRCRIEATVSGVVIGNIGYTTDTAATIRSNYQAIHFKGLTIDWAYIYSMYNEGTQYTQHWFDGCNFINSLGQFPLWRGAPGPDAPPVAGNPWFTECSFQFAWSAGVSASLDRGNTYDRVKGDTFTDSNCAVFNVLNDNDTTPLGTELAAFNITYTGSETSATIALSNANDATTRTFNAVFGSNNISFTVGKAESYYTAGFTGTTGYWPSDVARWVNETLAAIDPGWAATAVVDNTRRATTLGKPGTRGVAFAATSVKNTTLNLVTMFDVHADLYQQSNGSRENIIFFGNRCWNCVSQNFFLTGGPLKDAYFANNAVHNKFGSTFVSQLNSTHSHVVIAANSFGDQGLQISTGSTYTADAYCRIENNVFKTLTFSGAANATVKIRNNHLLAGAVNPSGGVGTTIGGTYLDLYVDPANGDFRPAGALLSNLKPSVLPYTIGSKLRPELSPAGAIAA